MAKINLNDADLLTSTEAAEIWGKNKTYVRTSLRQNPDKWPAGSWRKFGREIIVTVEGMEAVTGEPDPRKKK
ncbi:helix-turn-helix domain-containing protein [Lacticaseibacillus thailandensis]|uniref:Helix-turn-helix domain-containing protein n=1 Tax=Lacticaseibacillus thailandensis DSM 22698 = JCM 13996 TaxID=1423810 RepID=A0A0R2CA64_9LACO|nr:helix-turn-helix domain-containing protein [Lacticaseibacillus thailandensis]KRM88266.1 hypothetical protein FD19_GL000557 [Lacticaseibacillus thailandensis DSM 22698 = JCM 13996]